MRTLATIGYELASPTTLIAALRRARVQVLVDVRAVPNSRRPGFSKRALAAAVEEAGIDYLHLRGLGTPAAGRAAARQGRHEEMRAIFEKHLTTLEAGEDLHLLEELVGSGRSACLLCLEASPEHCHRSQVATALGERIKIRVHHLAPRPGSTGTTRPTSAV